MGRNSAFRRGLGALYHHCCGAHADNHPVAPAIERNGHLFDHVLGGRRAAGQESRAKPFDQMIGRNIVGRNDDDPPAASRPNPVLGHRHRLRRAGAGRVDLRVGTARADQLGELRVPHRKHAEQEAPVQLIGRFSNGIPQPGDAAVDLLKNRPVTILVPRAQVFQNLQLLAARAIRVISLRFVANAS